MKKIITLLIVTGMTMNLFAQGTLMIVGGGTERSGDDAWNYNPYTKAVTYAENNRVAIVAWGPEPDTWLRDYFEETCNANAAKHFDLSAVSQNDYPEIYDSLMTYDMYFFKGGDQYNYYSHFKNTDIEQAITDKYAEGGVIAGTSAGMAILSEVIFTAENGTVYPDEAINNPDNQYMNLANDFVDLAPGYLFDTHFAERGRFPRLVGMLQNWFMQTTGTRVTGLGVDDLTAMIIRNDSVYAYGTGAGNFYDIENTLFDTTQNTVVAQNIKVTQLLNETTFDLNSGSIEGFAQVSEPELAGEGGNYTVLLSGGIYGDYPDALMETLVNECGNTDDKILIITGSSSSNASTLITAIGNHTSAEVYHFEATTDNGSNEAFSDAIADASKFVFVDNNYSTLMDFIGQTSNGHQLDNAIREHHGVVAFVGDNSRFAGKTVINEYLDPDASYYGLLTFDPGLALLKTSVVMPNTFKDADYYENTTTSVPYAMLQDGLTFGIWLNKKNYVKYHVDNDSTWLDAYGQSPVMTLKNSGTAYGFSTTPNVGNYDPRMVAGFEEMTLTVFDSTITYLMGTELGLGMNNKQKGMHGKVYPNPAGTSVTCQYETPADLNIFSIAGKKIAQLSGKKCYRIDVADYSPGIYLFQAATEKGIHTSKVTIH